jgi:hypothetical protein
MNCREVNEHLPDFLMESLDNITRSQIEAHLSDCPTCNSEMQSLSAVWGKLAAMPEVEPTPALRERFYAMLDAYQMGLQQTPSRSSWFANLNEWLSTRWFRQPAWQVGFAVALLMVGIFVGYGLSPAPAQNQELAALRKEVNSLSKLVTISLLQQPSTTERLRGANFSSRLEQPDRETLSTLINTLDNDPSVNVRLAVLDALTPYNDYQLVRQGLIESLQQQASPLMQVALIDYFVESQTSESLSVLKVIEKNEKNNETVRQRAGWAIEQLQ